jgi:two-component system, sensor histidine kinase
VQSEVGKGTIFTLLLPASEKTNDASTAAPSPPSTAASSATARLAVLLVEDDARVRNATRLFLKSEGYDVTAVASFEDAVSAAQAGNDFRLLITDYHLGSIHTGVQVIAAVREQLGRELPAILITGDTSSAMRELRGDDALRTASKPINPDELMNLVRELSARQ